MTLDQNVQTAIKSMPMLTFTIMDDDDVIARAQLYIMESSKGEYGRIENVFVDEEYRGRGLGTELSKIAMEESRSLGHYKCTLASSRSNAQRIYEKIGFRKHGESYRIDFTTEDSL